jgi:hypothetical protein
MKKNNDPGSVSYELVSYNGQRQLYITEDGGLDLLYKINREKKITMVDIEIL